MQTGNKGKVPNAFDLNRSLMLFFEKKSVMEKLSAQNNKTSQPCVLYDVLLKELMSKHHTQDASKDRKLALLEQIKNIFDADLITLIKVCIKNDEQGIHRRLK
mgnify:CR=1 FL=1